MRDPAVDAYLAAQPDAYRTLLEGVRAAVLEVCPEAAEGMYYQMPGFRLRGKLLLSYAGFRRHCSIYPASGAVKAALADELAPYLVERATIRFTPDHPLPADLLRRIVEVRVAEGTGPRGGR